MSFFFLKCFFCWNSHFWFQRGNLEMETFIFNFIDIRWTLYGDHALLYARYDGVRLHRSSWYVLCYKWLVYWKSFDVPSLNTRPGILFSWYYSYFVNNRMQFFHYPVLLYLSSSLDGIFMCKHFELSNTVRATWTFLSA